MSLQPTDYSAAFAAPNSGQFLNSWQTGFNAALQDQTAQLQLNIQKQMNIDAAQVAQNPTPANIASLAIKYPTMSENFKRSYDMMTTEQQTARLNQAIPIYAAVQNGNPETAAQLLEKQAEGYDNSGQQQNAAQARAMAQFVRDHPDAAKTTMGVLLAGTMGPDKFRETFATVGKERREEELQPAAVQQGQAKAATETAAAAAAPAAQQASVGKTQAETQEIMSRTNTPPPLSMKEAQEASNKVTEAQQTADRLDDIAERLTSSGASQGVVGRGYEAFKHFWGSEDGITAMKAEFTRLRNTGMVQSMRAAGIQRITNVDMNVLSKGFPDENANPTYIGQFSKAMSVALRYDQLTNDIKSQWLYANRDSRPAKADLNIGGLPIAKGTTLAAATQQYIKFKLPQLLKQQNVNTINNRNYMQYANPQQGAQ